MNSIVNFLVESGISLSILSAIYLIFLRKETFFRMNRIFLLFSVLFSLVLPLLHIPVFEPQSNMVEEIRVTPYQNLLETVIVSSQGFSESVETVVLSSAIIVWIYLAGLFVLASLFMFRMIQLWLIIRRSRIVKANGYKLLLVNSPISPFSFLNYIFVSNNFQETAGHQRMLLHEMEHVRQGHTFDVLILEILTIIQWFNPFMWLLRRAIRENHEYLADKAVLKEGIKPHEYQELLLSQCIGGPVLGASHFNYSLIRNRIRMMTRMESTHLSKAKFSLGIILAAVLIVVFACEHKEFSSVKFPENKEPFVATFSNDTLSIKGNNEDLEMMVEWVNSGEFNGSYLPGENKVIISKLQAKEQNTRLMEEIVNTFENSSKLNQSETSDVKTELVETPPVNHEKNESQVFYIVEEMPEFPGGEAALRNQIAKSIRYPLAAQENGIQGRVYVQFVVSDDGSVKNATVVRGVDPVLDQEALRVVQELPLWIPGKQRGKSVDVSYTVPISFVLQ